MVDVLHSNCTTLLGLLGCNKSLTFRTKKYNSNKEIIFRNSAIPIFYGFRQNLIVFFMISAVVYWYQEDLEKEAQRGK